MKSYEQWSGMVGCLVEGETASKNNGNTSFDGLTDHGHALKTEMRSLFSGRYSRCHFVLLSFCFLFFFSTNRKEKKNLFLVTK